MHSVTLHLWQLELLLILEFVLEIKNVWLKRACGHLERMSEYHTICIHTQNECGPLGFNWKWVGLTESCSFRPEVDIC